MGGRQIDEVDPSRMKARFSRWVYIRPVKGRRPEQEAIDLRQWCSLLNNLGGSIAEMRTTKRQDINHIPVSRKHITTTSTVVRNPRRSPRCPRYHATAIGAASGV